MSDLENLTRVEKLGEILVKFQALKLSQLTDIIEEQKKNPSIHLGDIAVIKGFITRSELDKYLEIQKTEGKVVQDSLKELGIMTDEEKWQRLSQNERLGEVLLKRGSLRLSQLTEAIEFQNKNPNIHLGQLLVEKGIVTEKDINEALDWQKNQNQVVKEAIEEAKNPKKDDEEDEVNIF
ncbi:MAG: hypothetical protein U0457_16085 [Candidatus Sericytochromatia bacterium]